MQDPDTHNRQGFTTISSIGLFREWINQRLKSIEIRKELTDKWKKRGLKEGQQFAGVI